MLIDIEVDVATGRPPRVDATMHIRLDQPVGGDGTVVGEDRAFARAVTEAHHTAAAWAASHPAVAMVVGIRTTRIIDL